MLSFKVIIYPHLFNLAYLVQISETHCIIWLKWRMIIFNKNKIVTLDCDLFFQYRFYGKLVETFNNISECKTDVYFNQWFSLQFTRQGDIDH